MSRLIIKVLKSLLILSLFINISLHSFTISDGFAEESGSILTFIPALIRPGWGGFSENYTILPNIHNFGIVTDIQNYDLNNDGLQDLLLFRTDEDPFYWNLYIQALINTGNKSFIDQSNTYFPNIGHNWDWVQKAYLSDINKDGFADIIGFTAKGFSSRTLPPLIRGANGVFSITKDRTLLNNPGGMIPIDIDSDQDIDILVYKDHNFGDSQLHRHEWTLLRNDSSSNKTIFRSQGVVATSPRRGWDYTAIVNSPAVLDINSDGYSDFLYGGPKWKNNSFIDEATPLFAFMNTTSDRFEERSSTIFSGNIPQFGHAYHTATGDFYNNGHQSVVLANTGYDREPFPGERNVILKNAGTGKLTEDKGGRETHNYKGYSHAMDTGDIDNDGDLDIVYYDITGDDVIPNERLRILLNNGDGTFKRYHFPVDWFIGTWTAIRLVDLDNNGFPELVLGGMRKEHKSIIFWR